MRTTAPIAQLDRALAFEARGRRFEPCWGQSFVFLLALSLPLASCAFKRSPKADLEPRLPLAVAVLPVNNLSYDITMPALVRYFVEQEMESNGFKLPFRFNDLDGELRQMGVTNGNQINDSNLQNIGQSLKVGAVVQTTLYEPTLEKGVKTFHAQFRFISVLTGQTLWERKVEMEEVVRGKIPVRGTVTSDWTLKQVKSVAKSSAGKTPRKLVQDALKSLKR